MVTDEELEQIAREARNRFESRLAEADSDPEALGWDTAQSMRTRFRAATELYDFSDATVLDVGCGFGDFYGFLKDIGQSPAEYYGIDISTEILRIARERHPDGTFRNMNIFTEQFEEKRFDIATEFGVLNYNLARISNEEYLREYLRRTYDCADATLVNCLSTYREGDWEREEFVYYYSPEKALGYAQELSRDVVLKHDFEPIPQKEFHLLVR